MSIQEQINIPSHCAPCEVGLLNPFPFDFESQRNDFRFMPASPRRLNMLNKEICY